MSRSSRDIRGEKISPEKPQSKPSSSSALPQDGGPERQTWETRSKTKIHHDHRRLGSDDARCGPTGRDFSSRLGESQQRVAKTSSVDRQTQPLGRRSSDTARTRPALVGKEAGHHDNNSDEHRKSRRSSCPSRSASSSTAAMLPSTSGAGFFGNFDDSRYWDYAFRLTQRQDIGNRCRECKEPFLKLNEEIAVRRSVSRECEREVSCFFQHAPLRLFVVRMQSMGY